VPVGSFAGCHLRFNVLAFPSSRHTDSLTHFAAGAGVYKRKSLGGPLRHWRHGFAAKRDAMAV
jgi:hypothetical protein